MIIKTFETYMPKKVEKEIYITVEGEKIGKVSGKKPVSEFLDLSNYIVTPGFVDVHIHGFKGKDISEGSFDALNTMSKELVKTGVTSFLPTFASLPFERLKNYLKKLYFLFSKTEGAVPLGFHIEGAFINRGKPGAMNPGYFIEPDVKVAEEMIKLGVKMFTIAPELDNTIPLIKFLYSKGIIVSLGHTDADFETSEKAFFAGARSITHLFNAMPQFHHRNTGLLGAAFVYPLYLQFIADCVHTSEEVLKFVHLFKDRLVLITDCTAACGMSKGEYKLGDKTIYADKNAVRLKDGTLAGSTLTMDRGIRNLIQFGEFSMEEAIKTATLNPALSVNEKCIGAIEAGNFADFAVCDKNLNVLMTIIHGKVVYDTRKD